MARCLVALGGQGGLDPVRDPSSGAHATSRDAESARYRGRRPRPCSGDARRIARAPRRGSLRGLGDTGRRVRTPAGDGRWGNGSRVPAVLRTRRRPSRLPPTGTCGRWSTGSTPRAGVREWNWSVLDLAAMVCLPSRPRCEICPLASDCRWSVDGACGSRGGDARLRRSRSQPCHSFPARPEHGGPSAPGTSSVRLDGEGRRALRGRRVGSVSVSKPPAGRSSGPTSGSPRRRPSMRSTATSAISTPESTSTRTSTSSSTRSTAGEREPIPDHDLLVGGFPCQDYSVAKTLNQAHGIEGKKGVLWWSIYRILEEKRPRLVFLENVDRLLKSPATQRGRDFAIILACLSDLGYLVEWRVVNAADYGFPQRRRRVFIVAHLIGRRRTTTGMDRSHGSSKMVRLRARSPVRAEDVVCRCRSKVRCPDVRAEGSSSTDHAGVRMGRAATPFRVGGVMWDRKVWTRDLKADFEDRESFSATSFSRTRKFRPEFFIPEVEADAMDVPEGREARGAHRQEWSPIRLHRRSDRLPGSTRSTLSNDPHRRGWFDAVTVQAHHPNCRMAAIGD